MDYIMTSYLPIMCIFSFTVNNAILRNTYAEWMTTSVSFYLLPIISIIHYVLLCTILKQLMEGDPIFSFFYLSFFLFFKILSKPPPSSFFLFTQTTDIYASPKGMPHLEGPSGQRDTLPAYKSCPIARTTMRHPVCLIQSPMLH
uniref:Uncharacterized protein n=1 Tax=Cacopsylla melanoneura TaxID=428564 RepID=A0A8D8VMS9_9HEMI